MMVGSRVSTRATDEAKVREDINRVRRYVKEELFYDTIFIWDNEQLDEGSHLHSDFLASCKPILANGDLMIAPEKETETYMKFLWTRLMRDKSYRRWLTEK